LVMAAEFKNDLLVGHGLIHNDEGCSHHTEQTTPFQ